MDSDTGAYPNPPQWGGDHLGSVIALHGLLLLLAALIGAAIAYYLIKSGERARLERIREDIFKTVRKALDDALKERGPKMISAIEVLLFVANQQLGPFIGPGRSILSPLDALAKGLTGKTADMSPPAAATSVAAASTPAGSAISGAATPGNANANAVVVTPAVITNINVVGGRGSDVKPAAAPPPPSRPAERDMTIPEQKEALTRALDAFDNAWRKERVLPFLKEAQTALLTAPPVKEQHDDQGGGHGH